MHRLGRPLLEKRSEKGTEEDFGDGAPLAFPDPDRMDIDALVNSDSQTSLYEVCTCC